MTGLPLKSPPNDRAELLRTAGPQREQIYILVRETLDRLEEFAPWDSLYYPPTEIGAFLGIYRTIKEAIEDSPRRFADLPRRFLRAAVLAALDELAPEVMGDSTKQIVAALLDASPETDNALTRQVVQDTFGHIPPDALEPTLKAAVQESLAKPLETLAEEDVERILGSMPERLLSEPDRETLDSAYFFFGNIYEQARPDLVKLAAKLGPIEATGKAGSDERAAVCEIAADLKGKFTSSLMGAAAGLIADGLWDGAEIEPILFNEKAEEWERNQRLVETLREILESIDKLLEEVPLVDLVAEWKAVERVDRYALSALYGFLGDVGKLMKVSSRRALYSGDYHQIQTRESILSTRINELNTLHNMTWGIGVPEGFDAASCFPQMVVKTLELAVVLNTEILKKILGPEMVRELQHTVTRDSERRRAEGLDRSPGEIVAVPESLCERVPKELRSLIPLLYDEDLRTFLELLLGSVLKRASFSVQRRKDEREKAALEAAAKAEAETQAQAQKAETQAQAQETSRPPSDHLHLQPPSPITSDADVLEVDPELLEELGLTSTEAAHQPEPVEAPSLLPATETPEISGKALETSGEALPSLDFETDGIDFGGSGVEFGDGEGIELGDAGGFDLGGGGDFGEVDFGGGGGAEASDSEASDTDLLSPIGDDLGELAGPSRPQLEEQLTILNELHDLLEELALPTHPTRKSFDLVHRFLKRGNRIPPSMLQSATPFLEDLVNRVVPQLNLAGQHVAVPEDLEKLPELCMAISTSRNPDDMREKVPATMDRVTELLDKLAATTRSWIDECSDALTQLP